MSRVDKFLIVGGIKFVPTKQRRNGQHCRACAFHNRKSECTLDLRVEIAQGLNCMLDETHYKLAGDNELV